MPTLVPATTRFQELPGSDTAWGLRCNPLLAFLRRERTWVELHAWALEKGISDCRLRNMLAWLENARMARTRKDGDGFAWASARRANHLSLV